VVGWTDEDAWSQDPPPGPQSTEARWKRLTCETIFDM
jgi:hypothetical protein